MDDSLTLSEGMLVTDAAHPARGIGLVELTDGNAIQVRFFADGNRIVPCSRTDLRRHQYAAGAFVFSRTMGEQGIVQAAREGVTSTTYTVRFVSGTRRIPERDILPVAPLDDPYDLLRAGDCGDGRAFVLALQARRLQFAYSYDELVSLSNARIELLPHQVFVAHRVLENEPPRFLLADEVGLGKTIEAGLVIKELRARGAVRRVLVVAPAGLVPQWISELNQKFNEPFTRIDSITLDAHRAMDGPGPLVWQAHDNIVTSLHLLRSHEDYVNALAEQQWDLVVFDEAHHLRRYLELAARMIGGPPRLPIAWRSVCRGPPVACFCSPLRRCSCIPTSSSRSSSSSTRRSSRRFATSSGIADRSLASTR